MDQDVSFSPGPPLQPPAHCLPPGYPSHSGLAGQTALLLSLAWPALALAAKCELDSEICCSCLARDWPPEESCAKQEGRGSAETPQPSGQVLPAITDELCPVSGCRKRTAPSGEETFCMQDCGERWGKLRGAHLTLMCVSNWAFFGIPFSAARESVGWILVLSDSQIRLTNSGGF